jgi:hypothetical protein
MIFCKGWALMPGCSQKPFIDSSWRDKAWQRLGISWNLLPDWPYRGVVRDCTITKHILQNLLNYIILWWETITCHHTVFKPQRSLWGIMTWCLYYKLMTVWYYWALHWYSHAVNYTAESFGDQDSPLVGKIVTEEFPQHLATASSHSKLLKLFLCRILLHAIKHS